MKNACLILGLGASTACAAGAQIGAGTSPTPNASLIEHRLRAAVQIMDFPDTAFEIVDRMHYFHVPGASIAVVDDFRIVYAKGLGVKEYGSPADVDTTTLFLAGSISKPVFASGALQLVQDGTIALDEDVNASLKSWRLPQSVFTSREKVTLRRLLTHSAGLTVWGFPGYEVGAPLPTVQQVLDGAPPANTPPVRNDTFPGLFWRYSGGGMTVAQLLITDATGELFPHLMRRLVLDPSGMRRSTYENPLPQARVEEAASGHERVDVPVVGRFHVYPEMAAAGLWTTAADLARWAILISRSYNGHDGPLLSREMAQQMISRQVQLRPPYGDGYFGLGVAVDGDGDSLHFSHNGRDEGFIGTFAMWPKLGRGVFILTNGVSPFFLDEVLRSFGEVYRLDVAPRVRKDAMVDDSALYGSLAGDYLYPMGSDTMTFQVRSFGRRLEVYNTLNKRRTRLRREQGAVFFDPNTAVRYAFEQDSASGDGAICVLVVGQGEGARRAVRSSSASNQK